MKDLLKLIKQNETPLTALSLFYLAPLTLLLITALIFLPTAVQLPYTMLTIFFFCSFGAGFYLYLNEILRVSHSFAPEQVTKAPSTPKQIEPTISREKQMQILEENQKLQDELDTSKQQVADCIHEKEQALEELKLSTFQQGEKEKVLTLQIADLTETTKVQQKEILKLKQELEDTNFELTTLIQLNDSPSSIQLDSSFANDPLEPHIEKAIEDLEVDQLINAESDIAISQALEIAIEMTSANHLSKSSPALFSSSHYAIDIRKFSDLLHSEITFPAFLYSPEESKFIFITRPIRSLTEWPADAFQTQLNEKLLGEDRTLINQLHESNSKGKGSLEIDFITKSGETVRLIFKMERIPEGVFENHLVGVILKQTQMDKLENIEFEEETVENPIS